MPRVIFACFITNYKSLIFVACRQNSKQEKGHVYGVLCIAKHGSSHIPPHTHTRMSIKLKKLRAAGFWTCMHLRDFLKKRKKTFLFFQNRVNETENTLNLLNFKTIEKVNELCLFTFLSCRLALNN